jgi:hypothetical protein
MLIYSTSWSEHVCHLHLVFHVLHQHTLLLKRFKCTFGVTYVAYLGHVISAKGVSMDTDKVRAVAPIPRSVCGLRRFLGLAGYYCKFIKDYGLIEIPLTKMLKEGFCWDDDATGAFQALKDALSSALVLQMPDFSSRFIECDASGSGFGAVLHQGDGHLAFYSRPIAAHHAKLAAYERELIGLVHAVRHWWPYLWGGEFTILTNHYSFKFILDQCLSTIPQHQWVSKLFGMTLVWNTVLDILTL